MNLKWVVDGVSNYSPLFYIYAPTPQLAYLECAIGAILHGTRYVLSLCNECRSQTTAIIGLIKQLADVGTALS